MTTYTFTADQSAAIVARWNELADDAYQVAASDAYLVIGENFDADLEDDGCHMVEVPAAASKSGNPATFYIMEEEATLDE